jgi:hypothetical protein
MKHVILTFALLLAVPAITAFAAEIGGIWQARLQGRTVYFRFTPDSGKLTGVMTGLQENGIAISEGKISGDDVSFDIETELEGHAVRLRCLGKLSGGEMRFLMQRQGTGELAEFPAHKIYRGQL